MDKRNEEILLEFAEKLNWKKVDFKGKKIKKFFYKLTYGTDELFSYKNGPVILTKKSILKTFITHCYELTIIKSISKNESIKNLKILFDKENDEWVVEVHFTNLENIFSRNKDLTFAIFEVFLKLVE